MNNIKHLTFITFFSLLTLVLSGCTSSETTFSVAAPSALTSPQADFKFGTVTVGNSAAPLEVTITNNGTQRLDISAISLASTVNFQLDTMTGTNPCLTASPVLLAGENCTVEITFQPIILGPAVSALDITSNDPNTPKQLTLTGTSAAVSNSFNVTINQVEIINCPTPDVVAYVSVTDQANFPIDGLLLGDFSITEGVTAIGAPTTSDFVGNVVKPISIALVMDNSSSMEAIDISEMERAANKVVEGLTVVDEVEIIKFNSQVFVEQTFTSNQALLATAIDVDRTGTGTALYDAVQTAINDTALQTTDRKAVIVVTDGNNTTGTITSINPLITNAQTKGIPVFVVALGDNLNLADLQTIADDTAAELYEADVAQNLRTILEQQLSEVLFTDQYVLTYTANNPSAILDLTVDVTSGVTSDDTRQISICM